MSTYVNCYSDFRFQRRFKIADANGKLNFPTAAGQVTGITLRLAASPTGAALDPTVDNLSTSEVTAVPGRLYRVVDTAVLSTYILTALGKGAKFYAVWSKPGDLNNEWAEFIAWDRSPPR